MQLYRIHNEDESDKIELLGPTGIEMYTLESEYLDVCSIKEMDIYHFAEWLKEFKSFTTFECEDYHCVSLT